MLPTRSALYASHLLDTDRWTGAGSRGRPLPTNAICAKAPV